MYKRSSERPVNQQVNVKPTCPCESSTGFIRFTGKIIVVDAQVAHHLALAQAVPNITDLYTMQALNKIMGKRQFIMIY